VGGVGAVGGQGASVAATAGQVAGRWLRRAPARSVGRTRGSVGRPRFLERDGNEMARPGAPC
jgi:hypothetical protein